MPSRWANSGRFADADCRTYGNSRTDSYPSAYGDPRTDGYSSARGHSGTAYSDTGPDCHASAPHGHPGTNRCPDRGTNPDGNASHDLSDNFAGGANGCTHVNPGRRADYSWSLIGWECVDCASVRVLCAGWSHALGPWAQGLERTAFGWFGPDP